jgi:hypothetical protein
MWKKEKELARQGFIRAHPLFDLKGGRWIIYLHYLNIKLATLDM